VSALGIKLKKKRTKDGAIKIHRERRNKKLTGMEGIKKSGE